MDCNVQDYGKPINLLQGNGSFIGVWPARRRCKEWRIMLNGTALLISVSWSWMTKWRWQREMRQTTPWPANASLSRSQSLPFLRRWRRPCALRQVCYGGNFQLTLRHGPFSESDSCSDGQKIHGPVWNPKGHCRVHKSVKMSITIYKATIDISVCGSWIKPTPSPYILKTHFNINLRTMSVLPKSLFP
jgi:hypothetical protein